MKPIKQEDFLGCAVSCVAFILSMEYVNARRLFKDGEERAQKSGFYCKEIVEVLNKAGYSYQYKYVNSIIRNNGYWMNSIVFIKRSIRYRSGHYLVRYKNQWMDSWINFPDKNIKAGFRKRLPGKPIYLIFP